MNAYGILITGWIAYLLLHSVLAARSVKRLLNPRGRKIYRILYSMGSMVGLLALVFYGAMIEGAPYFDSHGMGRYISLMLSTFGVMTIQLAFRQYRLKPFLGFEEEKDELKVEGILKSIRHPIYSGIILLTFGYFLFNPTLSTIIACGCILFYLPVGIYLEERKLIALFGEKYLEYRRQVPALVPALRKREGN